MYIINHLYGVCERKRDGDRERHRETEKELDI